MITLNEEAVARERAAYWFGYHAAYDEMSNFIFFPIKREDGVELSVTTEDSFKKAVELGKHIARAKVGEGGR